MQQFNRAMKRMANTTDISGWVTAESLKHRFYAKKLSSLLRFCRLAIFGSVVSGVLASLAPIRAQAQHSPPKPPTVIHLSFGGNFGVTQAFGINNLGQVVGYYSTSLGNYIPHAFLWTPKGPNGTFGEMTDLGALFPAGSSYATSINDFGQVVGYSGDGFLARAFLWTPTKPKSTTGTLTDLGAFYSYAYGINNFGQVVGYSFAFYPIDDFRAFLWTPTVRNGTVGTMRDLGSFAQRGSQAYGINSLGQVVGSSSAEFGTKAFLWNPDVPNGTTGKMIDIGTIGTRILNFAQGINDYGQVVGYSLPASDTEPDNTSHAFVWTPAQPNGTTGSMANLGTIAGDGGNAANDINAYGEVAGTSFDALGNIWHAILWTPTKPNSNTGTTTLLDQQKRAYNEANAINDHGQVVGTLGVYDFSDAVLWYVTVHHVEDQQ